MWQNYRQHLRRYCHGGRNGSGKRSRQATTMGEQSTGGQFEAGQPLAPPSVMLLRHAWVVLACKNEDGRLSLCHGIYTGPSIDTSCTFPDVYMSDCMPFNCRLLAERLELLEHPQNVCPCNATAGAADGLPALPPPRKRQRLQNTTSSQTRSAAGRLPHDINSGSPAAALHAPAAAAAAAAGPADAALTATSISADGVCNTSGTDTGAARASAAAAANGIGAAAAAADVGSYRASTARVAAASVLMATGLAGVADPIQLGYGADPQDSARHSRAGQFAASSAPHTKAQPAAGRAVGTSADGHLLANRSMVAQDMISPDV